ncbi:alcohol dehydrogenase catalytic domain-containing protein [Lysobacter capsici]|uniref:alcohol dehydrogenase catalytic domain-containing protein n=1 Tax=Lysobacter capsici TaxID=435897 RepID=UPI00398C85B8
MKAYRIRSGAGIGTLESFERPSLALAAGQVRIRVRAVSLNFRDLMIADGSYLASSDTPVVPGSDAVGEIVELGAGAAAGSSATGSRPVSSRTGTPARRPRTTPATRSARSPTACWPRKSWSSETRCSRCPRTSTTPRPRP